MKYVWMLLLIPAYSFATISAQQASLESSKVRGQIESQKIREFYTSVDRSIQLSADGGGCETAVSSERVSEDLVKKERDKLVKLGYEVELDGIMGTYGYINNMTIKWCH